MAKLKIAVRLIILALVAWGVWRTVEQARESFQAHEFALSSVSPQWLLLAGLFYSVGMIPNWLFWHRTLLVMGQRPRLRDTLRAFFIGHLGKYVPGKALVVVLRTGLIRSESVDTTVAATSVFVETPTFMAVGSCIAAAILAATSDQTWLTVLAVGLMICAGVPTLPPIFRRIVMLVGVKRANPQIEQAVGQLNYKLMLSGWLSMSVGWVLFGMSMWATLRSMPAGFTTTPVQGPLEHLPLLTAAVSLAMVAGFLSLLPGGIGVRELVVIPLLAGPFGTPAAIVAAVLLRLTWLVAELVISAILYFGLRSPESARSKTSSKVESKPETKSAP